MQDTGYRMHDAGRMMQDRGMGAASAMIIALIFTFCGITRAGETIVPPEGTRITATFRTEKGKGPDKLFDGDPKTWMQAGGGTCTSANQETSVILRFPQPVENLAGVVTGRSDKYYNYYPEVMEFWVDSNDDGRFDTKVGSTTKLGGWDKCKGTHMFDGRLPKAYGLDIRVTRQHIGGGKRAWTMDEMQLVLSDKLPIMNATPNGYRVTYYTTGMPKGCTAKLSFPTAKGKGAHLLLDGNGSTAYQPKQGTAKKGKAASIFLRFPAPQKNLAGIIVGRSDKWGNYLWKKMELHVDTNGNGKYDTFVGRASGPGKGRKRFQKTVKTAHGIELRVTEQTIKGTRRAFILTEISGLVFEDALGTSTMKYVVEDFEEFTTWRTWASNTGQPKGERYFGGYTYLCGERNAAKAHAGQGVGILRYHFKDAGKGPFRMWCTRGDVWIQEAVMDKITFQANPQGYPCRIWFEITDARGKKAQTPKVRLEGNEWREYAVATTPKAMPATGSMKMPFRLKMLFMQGDKGGKGDILLDDIAVVGAVDRSKRISIRPVYEGLAFEPNKPVVAKYTVRNALDKQVQLPLRARLYSSYDVKRRHPIAEKSVPLSLAAYGRTQVDIDFGALPYGHYELVLTVAGDGIAAAYRDLLAVFKPNGKRVNTTPMWFGSMHHGDWTAQIENDFLLHQVVVPLGIDCYRTGAPGKELVEAGLLCNAGFGGMPKHLRLPQEKNDNRGAPNDYEKYYEWCKEQARTKYLPYKDSIISIEFYNEPDLPRFCYKPGIDTFDKMHRVFEKAFREVIPGVRIGTGSGTVAHGAEKPDFNRRMYQEIAGSGRADVAVWHAHGALSNYITRHRMVENWLKKGGRPKEKWLLGNSEAAIPSGKSTFGRLRQADNLVRKVAWARNQKNSLFYSWFITSDLFDAQHVGGGGDWGLLTISKRVKPSGQAYNELIRQLANTAGHGETRLDGRLQTCYYTRPDGSQVWLSWPNDYGAKFLQNLAATGAVTHTDMFGKTTTLTPAGGKISFQVTGHPFYLNAPAGTNVKPAAKTAWLVYNDSIGGTPGTDSKLDLTLKNTWQKPVNLALDVLNPAGKTVAQKAVSLDTGKAATTTLAIPIPDNISFGTHGYVLSVSSPEAGLQADKQPLNVVVADRVAKVDGPFNIDGKPDDIRNPGIIVLNKKSDTQDLVFDPNTPFWKDADDLSVKLHMAHDTKGIYLRFDVKDQSHHPGKADKTLWAKDSVQVAIAGDGKHTEVGMTEANGGYGYCWMSPDPTINGKPVKSPMKATRANGKTIYEMYLPFDMLGISYKPNKVIRMTFLVNEDDGRNRVRIMKWFDGIAAGKNLNKFGYLRLE